MSEDRSRLAVALNGYGLERAASGGVERDVLGWDDLRDVAVLAERLGYGTLFMPQQNAWEPTATLARIAAETSAIRLATGVLPLGARDPHELVLGARSLQEISGGRFRLGLGSDLSLAATKARVAGIRDALHGNEAYLTDAEMVLGPPDLPTTAPIAIDLAALGPGMGALAAEIADGVILNWCSPERVAEARATVGGRDDFTVAVYVRACLSHVDDHAIEVLRTTSTRYLALEPYRRQFERLGITPTPEAVVEATCVWGDRDRALARLGEYLATGADLVVVYPVPAGEAVSSISGTLMAAAPDPAVEG